MQQRTRSRTQGMHCFLSKAAGRLAAVAMVSGPPDIWLCQHTKTVAHWGFKRGWSEEETPENNTEKVFGGSVFICMEGDATLRSSPLQKPASINYVLATLPGTEQWHY